MKPALARGSIRCIGATTTGEYRKFIEPDPALERRFEKIVIEEPSRQEALTILRGLCAKLEAHHGVKISAKALEAAVDLTMRFDHDHRLPDKAIDVLDLAGARMNVPALSMAVKAGGKTKGAAKVTAAIIVDVLAENLHLPKELLTGELKGDARSRLCDLENRIKKTIVGQDEAIRAVCERLLVAFSDVATRRGPLGVFLFAGPTGVGKTELARAMAEGLFGGESNLIRLDMSEYMEEHSGAKLIGSPPGYVGYQGEGQLTGKLRSHPYTLVLLDEVEKAHPRVMDIFLQLFDEGRLTDAKGRTADASEIASRMVKGLVAHLKATKQIHLHVTDAAMEILVEKGFSAELGVRHLRRVMDEELHVPLARQLVDGGAKRMRHAVVDVVDGKLALKI